MGTKRKKSGGEIDGVNPIKSPLAVRSTSVHEGAKLPANRALAGARIKTIASRCNTCVTIRVDGMRRNSWLSGPGRITGSSPATRLVSLPKIYSFPSHLFPVRVKLAGPPDALK